MRAAESIGESLGHECFIARLLSNLTGREADQETGGPLTS
jgi:hypothetical protein